MHPEIPSDRRLAGPVDLLRRRTQGRWSLRAGVLLFQGVVVSMLLSTAAATFLVVERINYYAQRGYLASEQLRTVTALAAHLNRHSENVAELLLLGRSELEDLEAARADLERSLGELTALVEQEAELLRSDSDREEERVERERVARMRDIYTELDAVADRLLLLAEEGRADEVTVLFRDAVENGFSADLDQEIAATIADEEGELSEIRANSVRLRSQLVLLVLSVSLVAVLVTGAAGVQLTRTLTKSIRDIVSGTRAIGEGDLGYRIHDEQPKEFADLARQFNATASQLEAQRRDLLEVQAGLEAEIARRTGQLEEANARLQRLDQLRMQFLADISHELRTPLTVLRGEGEVALRGQRSAEDYRETLLRVVQLAGQMGRLVDDLLFLARAEVGAVRFDMERVLLGDILEVALADAEVLAEGRGLSIAVRAPSEPLWMEADAGRVTQALLIVLDNAVKYSDPVGTIDVELFHEAGEAVLRVANHGPTISKADLPFVFNRFHRGRPDGSARPEGSGLGLPIAKWIIDTHKGVIDIASEAGRTVVSIRLKLIP
jgi:signal transduction histidine kinase